jgi:hypothetical protein
MTAGASDSLRLDALRSLRGIARLIRFNPSWREDFQLDHLGFYRSFFAQILRLPLLLLFNYTLVRALGEKVVPAVMWQVVIAAVIALFLYMAISLLAVRLLKMKHWAAYITLLNWGDFGFSLVIAALSAFTLAGAPGLTTVRILWLVVIIPLQIMFIWRAAQETMAADVSATVLMVVLNIATSVVSDQLAGLILPT